MKPYSETTPTIDFNLQVVEPLKGMVSDTIGFIPDLITALGILLLGWAVAKVVAALIKHFLSSIHFDKIAEVTGMTDVISEGKIGMTPSAWTTKVVYYFGLLLTWITALDALSLKIPSRFFQRLGDFFSILFTALIILLIGLFLSSVLAKFVKTTATKLGIANAGVQAGIIQWAVILFTFVAGLSRLGMPYEFLIAVLGTIGITLCITFTIAVGVGSIPAVPGIIAKITEKKRS